MLRLSTYNVLADAYVRPSFYPATPSQVLVPGQRLPSLLERLHHLDSEVLCLQEVAADFPLPADYVCRFLLKERAGRMVAPRTFDLAYLFSIGTNSATPTARATWP